MIFSGLCIQCWCVFVCVRLLLNLASANCNYRATSSDALEVIPDHVHVGERRLQGCVVSYKISTANFGKRTGNAWFDNRVCSSNDIEIDSVSFQIRPKLPPSEVPVSSWRPFEGVLGTNNQPRSVQYALKVTFPRSDSAFWVSFSSNFGTCWRNKSREKKKVAFRYVLFIDFKWKNNNFWRQNQTKTGGYCNMGCATSVFEQQSERFEGFCFAENTRIISFRCKKQSKIEDE